MRRRVAYTLLLIPFALQAADNRALEEEFESKVRPILAKNCFACHTNSKMGGLDMRDRASLLRGGKRGAAVVPGDAKHSLMVEAIRQDHESLKMPPTGKLADEEIAAISKWVENGAVWPERAVVPKTNAYVISPEQRNFWSFRPVVKPEVPKTSDSKWARGTIDRFILAKLEEAGLHPSAPADKRTLIRRVSYDLTGLPATAEEIDAFEKDRSPQAYERVIDRLLASPRYGERWGRMWLDVARYSDDKLDPTGETPHPNAFRYRDWVIQAFNQDMPYNQFVKAQIAGDLMPDKEKYAGGLGLYALSPEFQDDRVDVTTRGFLGLTVACAQCHDHKFDPIPQKDYYSLLGVFNNTKLDEFPLAAAAQVAEFKAKKKRIEEQEKLIAEFLKNQADQLAKIFALRTADYLVAAFRGKDDSLDPETLQRWAAYLKKPQKEHPYLNAWSGLQDEVKVREFAAKFQDEVLKVYDEKKRVEEENLIRLGGSMKRDKLAGADLVSLDRDQYYLWRDLFGDKGILHYGETGISRFLSGEWKAHLVRMRAELNERRCELPEQYPFLQIISDVEKPKKQHVYVRGDKNNLGDEVSAHFLTVFSDGAPKEFTGKPARLALAEAMVDERNPLTARVIVNRIWLGHFGDAIVRTPSNFGQLGERPSHPELLDYLAARLMESGWSMKALHKEILLSATYQQSVGADAKSASSDGANRLFWRANRRRLDAEELRDSLLLVSGVLDEHGGGRPARLTDDNRKRTVYGYVSRKKLDTMLGLFDFPNPNSTSEQRMTTNVPLQSLFFLNSAFVRKQAEALVKRVGDGEQRERIAKAYRFVYGRTPDAKEVAAGLEFLHGADWTQYAQVLLSANEFLFVN